VSNKQESPDIEKQLQVLDVSVVDVLSHLEALLRHSHSIQRSLLELRSEAPPPPPQMSEGVIAVLTGHANEMHREWAMLGDIIRDLKTGIVGLNDESDTYERRSGLDRRRAEEGESSTA
jgi:hypothetical protein